MGHLAVDDQLVDPNRLAGFGFDPSRPIYKFSPTFGVDEIKAALFNGDFHELRPLEFVVDETEPDENPKVLIPYRMVLELAQVDYWFCQHAAAQAWLDRYRAPSWYLRGMRLAHPLVPTPYVDRLRVYLVVDPDGVVSGGVFQHESVRVICPYDPTCQESSAPLVEVR